MADDTEDGHDGEEVALRDGLLGLGDDGLAVGDDQVDGVAHDDLEDGALVLVRHDPHHQNLHRIVHEQIDTTSTYLGRYLYHKLYMTSTQRGAKKLQEY